MRIISKDEHMFAIFPTGAWHEWVKGSHCVNVYHNGREIDVYSFAWHKNKPSMLDFTSALQSYLEYLED